MADQIATRDAYGKALAKLGKIHNDIIVLDADLSKSTKTVDFKKAFPDRFFNLGIAEADMMDTAAGLATTGKKVFASTFAIFASGRAWEPIRNTICYSKLPVKIVATHAGISVGPDGGSHEAIEDIAIMRVIPYMNVFVPADGIETEKVIEATLSLDAPCYVRLGRAKVPVIYDENFKFEIGKANTVREGTDCTFIGCGATVEIAMKAADKLKGEGKSIRVIDMCSVKPLDKEAIIKAVKETKGIITMEEHSTFGGLGGAVAEVVVQQNTRVPMRILGLNDVFGESGEPDELFNKFGLTVDNFIKAYREIL